MLIMHIISTNQIIKILLFVITFVGCATYDYNDYIKSDYKNTPDWREADVILSELDTPEKIAVWMSNHFKFYDIGFRRRNYLHIMICDS